MKKPEIMSPHFIIHHIIYIRNLPILNAAKLDPIAMNRLSLSLISLFLAATLIAAVHSPGATDMTLWYNEPARLWEETVPLGNGRLGMMPDGGIHAEKVVLNEISMWSGSETDYSNPEASKSLPEIQRLLMEGRNKEAQDMMYEHFVPRKQETGGTYGCYQMLADLDISYTYNCDGEVKDYCRWLDLSTATAHTTFEIGGATYSREYFVPRGKEVIVMHIAGDRPFGFSLTAERKERIDKSAPENGMLVIKGTLDSGKEHDAISPEKGVSYEAAVKVIPVGKGVDMVTKGNRVTVRKASEAWIVVAATTDYWKRLGIFHLPSPVETVDMLTPDILKQYKQEGIAAHKALMDRAYIKLPATEQSALPTDERIQAFQHGDDPELAALYYNYGRYLLIGSTLPGFLPPNLQGLWANGCSTPWNGDYHTNINVQMNHWPVEQGNLAELHLPLIALTERAVKSGERTAKAFYGDNAEGWVMHMMTNVWNYTEPGEHPSWGATNTAGAWLCQHLWEHYLYNPSATAYLREIYPVMKGASEFFLSTMIHEPKHGWLVTAPSSSPENEFIVDDEGTKVSVCMGPAMDTQIVGELFSNVITAAETLGTDTAYVEKLRTAMDELPPMQIGSDGRLMEWLEEYREADPHHRHVSHLYALHPGNQISPEMTPELAEACRRTLDARGDGGTGWSRAWKINFRARLGDGDRAYSLFKALLSPAYTNPADKHRSGTFPNLFCSHPPFQMDGNWGGTSGISEMLVQSHEGFINILPALPAALPAGELHGFRTRGGAEVDVEWSEGLPAKITIDSPAPCRVKVPSAIKSVNVAGRTVDTDNGFFDIPAGKSICVIAE